MKLEWLIRVLLVAAILLGAKACIHEVSAAELQLEVLPSWDGTGKVGYRGAVQWQLTEGIALGTGVAYMPDSVWIVDLTPALTLGDRSKLWGQLGIGPAYSSSKTIDTRQEGSQFMFHIDAVVGYGPVYGGWTHYSNGAPWLGTPMPNMGVNMFTIGVKLHF